MHGETLKLDEASLSGYSRFSAYPDTKKKNFYSFKVSWLCYG